VLVEASLDILILLFSTCCILIQNRYASQVAELTSKLELCESSFRTVKAELKELKSREARIMTDFSELEEDNVTLQKQLMQAKQAQVSFESIFK
jgi:protein bicaudal D